MEGWAVVEGSLAPDRCVQSGQPYLFFGKQDRGSPASQGQSGARAPGKPWHKSLEARGFPVL